MMKKCPLCKCDKCKCPKMLLAVLIGFAYIFAYEFVLHGILLKPEYEATASLWRTPEEMKALFPMMLGFQFLMSAALFCIFMCGFEKSLKGGLTFGVKLGILCGLGMSYSYIWTPIPALLAVQWFLGNFVKVLGLGLIFGFLASKCCKGESCSTGGGDGKTC